MSYNIKKLSGQDRTATERNYVAEATRRRRRILQAGFFLTGRHVLVLFNIKLLYYNYNNFCIFCGCLQGPL